MIPAFICHIGANCFFNDCCADFTESVGNSQHFVAASLYSSGFMAADVPCFGGDHPLIRGQQSVDHCGISLGASHKKIDFRFRTVTGGTDFFFGRLTERIHAVTCGLLEIGFGKTFQNGRMHAFQIVGGKGKYIRHNNILFSFI